MRRLLLLCLAVSGCALRVAAPSTSNAVATEVSSDHAPDAASAVASDSLADTQDEVANTVSDSASAELADVAEEDEGEELEGDEVAEEAESHDTPANLVDGFPYTGELTDEALAQSWNQDPASLGSISLGFADEGRLINAVQFPPGDAWIVVSPNRTWATRETVDYLGTAIRKVVEQHPHAPPLRVNDMSFREGGYTRAHKSHQNGRDVDLGFYYPGTAEPIRVREREKVIDVALNWALVKALVTETDVQMILVDRRVQKVLYDHALSVGEDKAWLDSLFRNGRASIVRHARRHRDHFHVRFFNGRSQELGRRIAPLLAQRPDQNIAMHRVRRGDTLGAIAARYNSSVKAIQKANRMRSTFLRIAQVLKVPLRGPCTRCPVPPPVVLPARNLPPAVVTASGGATTGAPGGPATESAVLSVQPAAATRSTVATVQPASGGAGAELPNLPEPEPILPAPR